MRFQDAAKDARAVVYAGIQADPLVARAAGLLAEATPGQRILARAVMNGETTDAEAWRMTFPTLFGAGTTSPTDTERARSEAILACALEVADRGDETQTRLRRRGPRLDVAVQKLVEGLALQGMTSVNTIFTVVGDHGEGLDMPPAHRKQETPWPPLMHPRVKTSPSCSKRLSGAAICRKVPSSREPSSPSSRARAHRRRPLRGRGLPRRRGRRRAEAG